MSTEYSIKIYRKIDDKCIGEIIANEIKGIRDSGVISEFINSNLDNTKIVIKDLRNANDKLFKELANKYALIHENKMSILLAKSKEIKQEFEDENNFILEDIQELQCQISCTNELIGNILCVVENNMINDFPAYDYNARDLKKKKDKDTGYEYSNFIFEDDIYCIVHASY